MTISSTFPTFSRSIRAVRLFLWPSIGDSRLRARAWRVGVFAFAMAAILMAAARLGVADIGSYANSAPTPRVNSFTVSTLLLSIAALAFLVFLNASHGIQNRTASGPMLAATIIASICLVGFAGFCLVLCFLAATFIL